MKQHPLTPRKPAMPAAIASTGAFIAVVILGLAIHFVMLPPTAWLPTGDGPRTADLRFLLLIIETVIGEVNVRPNLFSRIDGFLALPWSAINALQFLDLHISLVIRFSAITMAALVTGMTVRS